MKLTPEQAVLFAAISLDDASEERLHLAVQQDLSWPALEQLAVEQNVLALLYQRLKQTGGQNIPAEAMLRLKDVYYTHALRNQRLAELTLEILDLFRGEKIQAVPFKGPALAVQAYGELALRQFLDIDLLVEEMNFRRAHDLLLEAGFHAEMDISPAQDRRLLRAGYDMRFNRQQDIVELHWAPLERSHVYPLKTALFWDDLCKLPLLGRPVAMFAPETTALLLCMHGTKHQWQKLKWIADLAYLVHRQANLDWDRLMSQAHSLGFRRMVALGLNLSERVLGVRLPSTVRAGIGRDPRVGEITDQVYERTLLKRSQMSMLDNNWFYFQSRERLRDRLYYLYDQALVPKQADWLNSRLPPALYGVYYFLRPLRLAWKLSRQALILGGG